MLPIGSSFFCGFGLAQTPTEFKSIIENNRNITAKHFQTAADAYVELVNQHIDRCKKANITPTFPRWEDWHQVPYFTMPNTVSPPITMGRTFVLWNLEFAGVYDDIDIMISDFVYMGNLSLFEAADEFDAINIVNCLYKDEVYRLMPYIVNRIPFLEGPLSKNMLHRMPYLSILLDALNIMPEEVHGLAPCNLNSPSGLNSNHSHPNDNADGSLLQIVEIIK